jgi:uncharacterized integral membrane protein (TIGR00698 family)|tara:strand:- start:515 stop:1417 length:903 start_codon:yes stop_codon:yes gene_type:complete
MRYLLCIIFISIAVVINIPVLALMLGIIFVSIKSHRNLIAPSLGTKLLQAGIIIIGFTTTSSTAISLISEFFLQVSLFVIAVFLIGILLAKAFKINNSLGLLISSGTAICGATAIAAIAPIIKSKPKELLIALSIIFIFNAIAIVAFPLIGQSLEMSYEQFGVWSAMAIHDTGSVIGAAMSYGGNSAEVAATLKLGRTLWLIPLIIFLSISNNENAKVKLPIFVMIFILAIFMGSIFNIKDEILVVFNHLSDALIIAALFCIGSQINFDSIKQANIKVISFAFVLWIFALIFSYALLLML